MTAKAKRKKPVTMMSVVKRFSEQEGYPTAVVESRIPTTHIAKDLFGIFDLLAIRPRYLLGIQVTSISNASSRRTRILRSTDAVAWLAAGGKIDLVLLRKRGAKVYECRAETFELRDQHVIYRESGIRWPRVIEISQSEEGGQRRSASDRDGAAVQMQL